MAQKSILPIESLARSLKKRFPDAQVSVDRPRKASGMWFLDISRAKHPVIVQCQDGKEFGISYSQEHAYGVQVDQVYQDEEAAYGRIVSLLLSRTFTTSPPAGSLKELRKKHGLPAREVR